MRSEPDVANATAMSGSPTLSDNAPLRDIYLFAPRCLFDRIVGAVHF
jgi:hypothetical protein